MSILFLCFELRLVSINKISQSLLLLTNEVILQSSVNSFDFEESKIFRLGKV